MLCPQRTPELIDAVGSEVDRVLSLDDFWTSGGSDAASPSKPKRTALLESALLRESGRVSVDSVMSSPMLALQARVLRSASPSPSPKAARKRRSAARVLQSASVSTREPLARLFLAGPRF